MKSVIFLAAAFATNFASGALKIIIIWLLLDRFGSKELSLVIFIISLAQFLGAVGGGHLTDKYNRKTISLVSNFLGAGALIVLAATIPNNQTNLVTIILPVIIAYTALSVNDNSMVTMIPALVSRHQIRDVNGYFITVCQVAFLVSPLIIGQIIDWSGSALSSLAISILAYVLAGVFVSQLTVRSGPIEPKNGNDRSTFRFLITEKSLIYGMMAAVAANLFIVPIGLLLIPIRLDQLSYTATEIGYFYSSFAFGVALAGLVSSRLTSYKYQFLILNFYLTLAAAIYVLTYFFGFKPIVLLCGLGGGYFLAYFEILWNTIMQTCTPKLLLGRIYAIGSWSSFAGRSFGLFVLGLIIAMADDIQMVTVGCIISFVVILQIIGMLKMLRTKTAKLHR